MSGPPGLRRDAFVASVSRWRMAAAFAGCAGFVALGVWLARMDDWGARIVGTLSIVTFGVFALLGVRRATFAGPVLRIDAGGIWWREWRDAPLAWREVAAIHEIRVQRQRFLAIELHHPEQLRHRGAMMAMNQALGFGDVTIGVAGTDRSHRDLCEAVARFAPVAIS